MKFDSMGVTIIPAVLAVVIDGCAKEFNAASSFLGLSPIDRT